MAALEVSADGQFTAAHPDRLGDRLRGARLTGLSARDAADVVAALAAAPPGGAPTASGAGTTAPAAGGAFPAPRDAAPAGPEHGQAAGADPRSVEEPIGAEQPPIRVRLLGPVRITAWGEEISTGLRGTARALLAYYLLQPEGATAEAAIDALWPDADAERGRQRFWTALGNLRSRLRGPQGNPEAQIVARHGEHYRADADLLHVDVWNFQAALADAHRAAGDPTAEAAALRRAVAVYRGDLADGADYPWAEAIREDLHRRALDALVRLADLHHDRPRQAVAALEHAIALDPYAEEIYRRLIVLHQAAGRPDAARRTYHQLSERLADLDLEPDEHTGELLTISTPDARSSHDRQPSRSRS